jgi:hypothetical protein
VELVDRVARERFAAELAQYLGPSLSASGQVVRIRNLSVRVRIPAEELGETALLRVWLDAFGRALFEALAYPAGTGPVETVRAANRAQFLAMFLRDIAAGGGQRWQYAEFQQFLSGSPAAAILAILHGEPAETLATLAELHAAGALELVLARLDDLALEQLFVAIANQQGVDSTPLSVAHLAAVAKWALASPPPHGWNFESRRQALRLFIAASKSQGNSLTPRRIYHALLALFYLLESPDAAALLSPDQPSPDAAARASGKWTPAEVIAFFQNTRNTHRDASELASIHALLQALEPLRPLVPSAAASPKSAAVETWVHSDCAGIFLLTALVRPRDMDRFTLAGLALSALGRFDPEVKELDPAVALFAGFTGDPDMERMRTAFRETGRAEELDRMAAAAVLEFGSRIRGFRKAPRQAVVRQFLARPGRIRVDEERVFVILAPNPFHIALHISGMDGPVERVPWLAGRRVDFHLEGL